MTNDEAINEVVNLLEKIITGEISVEKEDIAYMDMLCEEMRVHEKDKTNSEMTLRKIGRYFDDLRYREIIPPTIH